VHGDGNQKELNAMKAAYAGLVSSDWSECLSPNGPFDVIGFHYPELQPAIETIFRQYTGNAITLSRAVGQVSKLLPGPITVQQMDTYLDSAFMTYRGVPELIAACLERRVAFMINTTGMLGYFQRVLAKGLLSPTPTAISAHSWVRFEGGGQDPFHFQDLHEIADKAANTAAMAARLEIRPESIVLMGDSGGDGPHFEWGARVGARLIGCMVKPSLAQYCRKHGIGLHPFGHAYAAGENRVLENELAYDYSALIEVIEQVAL
jgi:hypothetical protein